MSPARPRRSLGQNIGPSLPESSRLRDGDAPGIVYGELIRQSNMLAFSDLFWRLGIICLAMIPWMLLIKSAAGQPAAGLSH